MSGTAFAFMHELRKYKRLVPKKSATQSVAAVSSEERYDVVEDNLAQRLATRIALTQGKSGRFKSDLSSAKKFTGQCFHCGKPGHMKKEFCPEEIIPPI